MLTPHDIEVKSFSKGFRGYKMEEVGEFMQMLLTDYDKLYRENSNLKSKISVLVEKLEEYKEMESSLRNALVSAQKMGESMIKEAQSKSEMLLTEAGIKAERLMNKINIEIYKEKQNLENARREASLFKAKMVAMYQGQISLMEGIPELKEEELTLRSIEAQSRREPDVPRPDVDAPSDDLSAVKDEPEETIRRIKYDPHFGLEPDVAKAAARPFSFDQED